ncbi:MAG: NADPH-dependent F420 reductase [Candidatus Rokubacteria bacterium]|nr:NADPH-dependent F420 reductase [Candidatus Rokubacteria bacterium]
MRIAILGGTGKEGMGLALRWLKAGHPIIIGSRDAARARAKADELRAQVGGDAGGMTNPEAAAAGDLVVLTLPYTGLAATLPEVKGACQGKVIVSAVVPLAFGGGRLFVPPPIGSAAEEAQQLLGAGARVIAAFHHIAAHELASLDQAIDCDLLLCGDDPAARQQVAELGTSMGLRALDIGPLSNAGLLEGITAVLAMINRRYKVKNSGIKITGL